MNRESALRRLAGERFDVLVVGGGATGLGCAVDAVSRGYACALIEAEDFAKATSSRSTKLVHGGVRYLRQGNVALVREALAERARLLHNAPSLVHPLAFAVPAYSWAALPYYAIGLRLYDALASGDAFPRSRMLSARATREAVPPLRSDGLRGSVVYWDAQFDDARLAIALALTAAERGAAVANYLRAESLLYEGGRICGVTASDAESGARFEIRARAVINAAGIFGDTLRGLDVPGIAPLLTFSRGSHVVVSARALPLRDRALLVPRTPDGRVLFAIPWYGHALIGTTEVPVAHPEIDPAPSSEEIAYILATIGRYVERPIARDEVRSAFAGLRPLVNRAAVATARLSREHAIEISPSGMLTIAGGKWTTYRKMAQDVLDALGSAGILPAAPCRTANLALCPAGPQDDAAHAIRHEMARTVEDLLARRSRALFVDAAAARAQAPAYAQLLARELGRGEEWAAEQVRRFEAVALRYTGV